MGSTMTEDIAQESTAPPAPPEEAAVPTQTAYPLPLEFTGKGSEFFRIWIVNIALSVVTLGIYSAWATVRTRRYFYGKTTLDGTPFQFTARAIPILIGRLIALAVFGTYSYLGAFKPAWAIGFLIFVILPLTPWIIVKSQRFRARYSSWRNIRFGFDGTYGDALVAYVLLPIGALFTLFIIQPLVWKQSAHFQYSNLFFGTQRFKFDGDRPGFWSTFWFAVLLFFGLVLLLGLLGYGLIESSAALPDITEGVFTALFLVLVYAPLIGVVLFVQGRLFNAVLNGVSFGQGHFAARMSVPGWIWVQLSNLFLIIITFGLFYPWAKVRTMRFRVKSLGVIAMQALVIESAGDADDVGAAGAELASDFDFDISLF